MQAQPVRKERLMSMKYHKLNSLVSPTVWPPSLAQNWTIQRENVTRQIGQTKKTGIKPPAWVGVVQSEYYLKSYAFPTWSLTINPDSDQPIRNRVEAMHILAVFQRKEVQPWIRNRIERGEPELHLDSWRGNAVTRDSSTSRIRTFVSSWSFFVSTFYFIFDLTPS